MSYQQLTQEQRYHIWALKKAGLSRSAIAKEAGLPKSTLSRQLPRHTGQRGDRPQQAPLLATTRQQKRATASRIAPGTWQIVEDCLGQAWSPEQVSAWLWREHQLGLSHVGCQSRGHRSVCLG
jgi:IS30 family transposase